MLFKVHSVILALSALLIKSAIASPLVGEVSTNLTTQDAWSDLVLSTHNSQRAKYGAKPLTWNANLYSGTLSWAKGCKFQHSGGNYGENLYAEGGTGGDNNKALTSGVTSWMNEASKYNYNNPGFSSATGHFTQVVWKSTTQVACAVATCGAGTIFSGLQAKYLVCRYTPPGNYAGQFPANVGRPQ